MPKPTVTTKQPPARIPAAKSAGRAPTRSAGAGAISMRMNDDDRSLIDHAAVLAGKSRSEFMLDAARRAASETILDRTLFRMKPIDFTRFTELLDAPPQPSAKLRRLLQTKAPWE
jgi:uncharacterized protein (DUF1778 family)